MGNQIEAVVGNLDDIPEDLRVRDLFSEKDGKYELTGIKGVKTSADVDRLQKYLKQERDEHAKAKDLLAVWGDLNHEEVVKKLDKLPELEAAAKGKLDEAAIEDIVNRRVEGTLRSRMSPLERAKTTLEKERDTLLAENTKYKQAEINRIIGDGLLKAASEAKTEEWAREDILMYKGMFEVNEEGKPVTKEGGLDPEAWLMEMQPKRPGWWPPAQGAGARGGGAPSGIPGGGVNPWSHEGWNLTKQGEVMKKYGREKAEHYAKAAGTVLGGARPQPRKSTARA